MAGRRAWSWLACSLGALLLVIGVAAPPAGAHPLSGLLAVQLTNPDTGVPTLATVRPDGSRLRHVLSDQQAEAPAWSGDGRWIAFDNGGQLDTPDGHVHVFVVHPNGRGLRQVTSADGDQGFPTWSPDGRFIAFDGNWPDSTPAGRHAGVGIVDLRTGGVREITTNPFGTCDTCFDGTPAWSPNGRLIAFTRSNSTGSAVFTVRPDGRDIRRLTGYELDAAHSTWSADSRRIAFNTDDDGLNPNIANDIAIVPATGGTVRNVTHNEQGVRYSFQPTWSPDGRHIAFVDFRAGDSATHLYVMRPDGTDQQLVPLDAPFPSLPDWGPGR